MDTDVQIKFLTEIRNELDNNLFVRKQVETVIKKIDKRIEELQAGKALEFIGY